MEVYETDYDLEEETTDQEDTERSYQEEPETDPDESQEEEAAEEQPDEEAGETEAYLDEEVAEEDPETVSENDLVISGDVIVFPEGYDLSDLEGEQLDVELIVQTIEKQSDIMTAGFTCTCFMLGILAGALVITGFRLRRI